MGRWTDIATWRGGTPNHGGEMVEHRGLVLHIAEGGYEGTIAWCLNPASSVSAHFVVAKDGRIAQMVDTDVTAWTQRVGNGHWLSVENEGHTPGALTAAQVDANARILAKGHEVYGYPLQLAYAPSGRGLGHHSMGAENGVDWGHSDCPGPAIKAQKPAILARALQIANGDDMPITADDATLIAKKVLEGMAYGKAGTPNRVNVIQILTQTRDFAKAAAAAAGLDADELKAITDAAHAGVLASADELVAAVVAKLPSGTLTRDDVEAAVREAFAGGLAPDTP